MHPGSCMSVCFARTSGVNLRATTRTNILTSSVKQMNFDVLDVDFIPHLASRTEGTITATQTLTVYMMHVSVLLRWARNPNTPSNFIKASNRDNCCGRLSSACEWTKPLVLTLHINTTQDVCGFKYQNHSAIQSLAAFFDMYVMLLAGQVYCRKAWKGWNS